MPLVVLFSFAAFHSSPHCFMMLCAWTGPVDARPNAPANKKAESATLKDLLIIVVPPLWAPGDFATPLPAQASRRAPTPSWRISTEPNMNIYDRQSGRMLRNLPLRRFRH